jgi:hypothetical protein
LRRIQGICAAGSKPRRKIQFIPWIEAGATVGEIAMRVLKSLVASLLLAVSLAGCVYYSGYGHYHHLKAVRARFTDQVAST